MIEGFLSFLILLAALAAMSLGRLLGGKGMTVCGRSLRGEAGPACRDCPRRTSGQASADSDGKESSSWQRTNP